MIKSIFIAAICLAAINSKEGCNNKTATQCYKAKLQIKGICSNYTIKVLDDNIDKNLVESSWTDESTGKTYTNVFGLGSPCTFPADIKEGDEFYFTVDNNPQENCNVCMAYYPTPQKKLAIKVSKEPCQ